MKVKTLEHIFKGIHHAAHPGRHQTQNRAEQERTQRKGHTSESRNVPAYETAVLRPANTIRRTAAVTLAMATGSQTARTQFKEQQFDRQQHRRKRSVKGRGHTRRRASDQQRRALGIGQIHPLRDQRSNRSAGHNDRTFRAKGSAGTDGRSQRRWA